MRVTWNKSVHGTHLQIYNAAGRQMNHAHPLKVKGANVDSSPFCAISTYCFEYCITHSSVDSCIINQPRRVHTHAGENQLKVTLYCSHVIINFEWEFIRRP